MKRLYKKACVKRFGFHAIRHLTASILYRKGYSIAHIQAVLRHKNPDTTSQYLRSLRLQQVREALEEELKVPAKVIPFQRKTPGRVSSEG
jgi:integrase